MGGAGESVPAREPDTVGVGGFVGAAASDAPPLSVAAWDPLTVPVCANEGVPAPADAVGSAGEALGDKEAPPPPSAPPALREGNAVGADVGVAASPVGVPPAELRPVPLFVGEAAPAGEGEAPPEGVGEPLPAPEPLGGAEATAAFDRRALPEKDGDGEGEGEREGEGDALRVGASEVVGAGEREGELSGEGVAGDEGEDAAVGEGGTEVRGEAEVVGTPAVAVAAAGSLGEAVSAPLGDAPRGGEGVGGAGVVEGGAEGALEAVPLADGPSLPVGGTLLAVGGAVLSADGVGGTPLPVGAKVAAARALTRAEALVDEETSAEGGDSGEAVAEEESPPPLREGVSLGAAPREAVALPRGVSEDSAEAEAPSGPPVGVPPAAPPLPEGVPLGGAERSAEGEGGAEGVAGADGGGEDEGEALPLAHAEAETEARAEADAHALPLSTALPLALGRAGEGDGVPETLPLREGGRVVENDEDTDGAPVGVPAVPEGSGEEEGALEAEGGAVGESEPVEETLLQSLLPGEREAREGDAVPVPVGGGVAVSTDVEEE